MELEYLDVPDIATMRSQLMKIPSWRKLLETGWNHEDLIQRAWAYKTWVGKKIMQYS